MRNEEPVAVVIDNGSGYCKAGFAGDDEPKVVCPSIVGRFKDSHDSSDMDCFVGSDAHLKRDLLALSYPIERGVVTNWDDLEKIWKHLFKGLKTEPKYHPLLMTDAPLSDGQQRERMTQIVFESLECPAMCVAVQAVLSLYASGRTTGTVLDCGDGVTHVVPVYRGHAESQAILRLDLAGRDLTQFLATLLEKRGCILPPGSEHEISREIKEKLCTVGRSFEQDITNVSEAKYKLPDGQLIVVGEDRLRCPEVLFKPTLADVEGPGIHELIVNSIAKCDSTHQKELFGNVVLSGGSSMFAGMPERLQQELETLAGKNYKVKVIARPERRYSAWNGGSTMAQLPTFLPMAISKQDYEEFGPSVVLRKCC